MRLPRLATRVGSRKVQDPADDSCQEHSQGCPPVETRHRRCVDGVGACGVQGFLLSGWLWCPRVGGRLLPGPSLVHCPDLGAHIPENGGSDLDEEPQPRSAWWLKSADAGVRLDHRCPAEKSRPVGEDPEGRFELERMVQGEGQVAPCVHGGSGIRVYAATCSAMDSATSTMFSVLGGLVKAAWARRLGAWHGSAWPALHSCVSSRHRSSSSGPNRSRGSISRTTR